jgi:hypothetical protein
MAYSNTIQFSMCTPQNEFFFPDSPQQSGATSLRARIYFTELCAARQEYLKKTFKSFLLAPSEKSQTGEQFQGFALRGSTALERNIVAVLRHLSKRLITLKVPYFASHFFKLLNVRGWKQRELYACSRASSSGFSKILKNLL